MIIAERTSTEDAVALQDYFEQLARQSIAFLDSLPIELTPQPLAYALESLAPAVESMRTSGLQQLRAIARPDPVNLEVLSSGVGLNTVGMLTDRFTILLIKEWSLRHKGTPNPAKADALFATQTRDIIAALALAQPGSSSLNSKITSLRSSASATDWSEAFWGLLTTNLLMWESQEMLYIRDISTAPYEELRAYIAWFSKSNIQRNDYIELSEKRYWQTSGGCA
ncbi:hypothetical protein [Horticoccus sp. 23ND18S-11]|uniref:hypothetical protein n=1 Tax=Horticoccus sp. 23ND18S-11 TaxID=3391832 RepID=UPI0039C95592